MTSQPVEDAPAVVLVEDDIHIADLAELDALRFRLEGLPTAHRRNPVRGGGQAGGCRYIGSSYSCTGRPSTVADAGNCSIERLM